MNEQWRWRIHNAKKHVQERAQPYIDQFVPTDMHQDFRTWRARKQFEKLDFNDYTDDIGVGMKEFEASRANLVNHLGEVLKGRGGKSQQEADDKTAAWIDNLGQHFTVVATLVSGGEDIHPVHGIKNLASFVANDEKQRTEELAKLVPHTLYIPPIENQNLKLWNIIYSFADPEKEWATDPAVIKSVEPMPRDQAVELYKEIIVNETNWMLLRRAPNKHEAGAHSETLKKAALGVGAAAVLSMLLGPKRQ